MQSLKLIVFFIFCTLLLSITIVNVIEGHWLIAWLPLLAIFMIRPRI